jgi:hypothetical protein
MEEGQHCSYAWSVMLPKIKCWLRFVVVAERGAVGFVSSVASSVEEELLAAFATAFRNTSTPIEAVDFDDYYLFVLLIAGDCFRTAIFIRTVFRRVHESKLSHDWK